MLVFCSHRGRSLECRKCAHSVAHEPIHRNGGPFTCDGGHQCLMAEAVAGVGMDTVVDGEEKLTEVHCVPVGVESDVGLLHFLRKVEVAFGRVLDEAPRPVSWQEKLTNERYARLVLTEVRKTLGKV